MKYLLLILLAGVCYADNQRFGPKYDSQRSNLEFHNVYRDINAVPNGVYKSSSMTLQGITVDSITIRSSQSGITLGKWVQVQQGTTTVSTTQSGQSFTATNLTVKITPSSTSNKILLLVSGEVGTNTTGERCSLTINLHGSNLPSFSGIQTGTGPIYAPVAMTYLDSPASTSQLTYTVMIESTNGNNCYWMPTAGISTIQAIEIAP